MSKFIQWFVYSSSDPERLSATVKGLAGFIPSILLLTAILHLNVSGDTLQGLIDSLTAFISGLASVISAGVTLFGFIRKLWTTARGTNLVIQGFHE